MRLSATEAYEKYADRVFAAAFAVCRDRADADDVTQDTFTRYIARDQQYESEEHIKAWLLRVAVNRARDLTRAFWRKNRAPWEDHVAELAFEEPADSRLFAAVMSLPERYRTAIHLFYRGLDHRSDRVGAPCPGGHGEKLAEPGEKAPEKHLDGGMGR